MVTASPSTRARFDAVVRRNTQLCREHFELTVQVSAATPFPTTQPGQFIQIGCRPPDGRAEIFGQDVQWEPGDRPALRQPELCHPLALLRRPFSLAWREDTDDGALLTIVHREVGVGTRWLATLNEGDPVDLIGPLGNSFTLPAAGAALLVGGGVGLPPMFYLARELCRRGVSAVAFIGALTRDLLAVRWSGVPVSDTPDAPSLSAEPFAGLGVASVITTDDGSLGMKGRITDGLLRHLAAQSEVERKRTTIYTCGPHRMMHAVAELADQYGVACEVCMEQAMACGMGTCQSCVVKMEDRVNPQGHTDSGRPWRYRLACTDGPVFSSGAVVW